MEKTDFQLSYTLSKDLPTPLYTQLVNAVISAVDRGVLQEGQIMPSINSLSSHYGVGRSTIEKGYCLLRDLGVLESRRGKGFFISKPAATQSRILFLFSEFCTYEKMIFNAFSKILGSDAEIEMAVYHSDPINFARIIHERKGSHSHYLFVPKFSGNSSEEHRILGELPEHKVILLDLKPDESGFLGGKEHSCN